MEIDQPSCDMYDQKDNYLLKLITPVISHVQNITSPWDSVEDYLPAREDPSQIATEKKSNKLRTKVEADRVFVSLYILK